MVEVTVDITGYFFSRTVNVPKEATVQEVMAEAVAANATAANDEARLLVLSDLDDKFLNEIIVVHRGGSAKSRQVRDGVPTRQYDDGIFSFADDQIEIEAGPNGTSRFAPRDPNASRALAWQFYVYKETSEGLVDLSRSNLGGLRRQVEAFSEATPFVAGDDDAKYQVVWRLVALALRPDQLTEGRVALVAGLLEANSSEA
ncbi:MAG: hypothetical protein AAFR39_06085 [Pseudomonadota bacterium]